MIAAAIPAATWDLVWQSRSGPPQVPWLGPDVNDGLRTLAGSGGRAALIAPIGFVTDHMEVMWDLDHQARATADALGVRIERAVTPGTVPDPRFVRMWADLVDEHRDPGAPVHSLSRLGVRPTPCAATCCPPPARR
ncbi:MAG: ferrochelatase [Acidimicrobiales bacterium]